MNRYIFRYIAKTYLAKTWKTMLYLFLLPGTIPADSGTITTLFEAFPTPQCHHEGVLQIAQGTLTP